MNAIRLTIFSVLLCAVFQIRAQNLKTVPGSFKIINNNHKEQEAFYISSIEQANMENYRLKDKNVTIHFENGFDCVMISAKELFMNGKSLHAGTYPESFSATYTLPVFFILPEGGIVASYSVPDKKPKKQPN